MIVSGSQLSVRTVKEALFILIQHNLLRYQRAHPGGSDSFPMPVPVLYRLEVSAVLQRLLFPVFPALARRALGQGGATAADAGEDDDGQVYRVVLECAKHGRVPLRQLSALAPAATAALLEAGFLEPLSAESSIWGLAADAAGSGSNEGSLASGCGGNGSPAAKRRRLPPSIAAAAVPLLSNSPQVGEGADLLFVRLAGSRFREALLQHLLIDLTSRRINEAAGHVMQAALACSGAPATTTFSPFQVSSRLSARVKLPVDTAEGTLTAAAPSTSSLVQYLDTMAQEFGFFTREDSRGQGLYSISRPGAVGALRMRVIETFIRARLGQASLRLFRILRARCMLEEKTISKVAMMTAKETRERLFELLRWGLVHLQEVPKTLDHAPARTFYLWTIPRPIVFARLADVCLKAWINLQERANLQRKRHQLLLAKSERLDVLANPELLSEAEKGGLNTLRRVLGRLHHSAHQVAIELAVLLDDDGGGSESGGSGPVRG